MGHLNQLLSFFFNSNAESERNILKDIFVTNEDFFKIIEPRSGSMQILVGNKGSGKSAILEYLLQKSTDKTIPAIRITPTEFENLEFEDNAAPATVINSLYSSILKAMAIEAGKNLKGLLKEDEARLFNEAVSAGKNTASITSKALNILAPIGTALTNINFHDMIPKNSASSETRKSDLAAYSSDTKVFYVLLDDVDLICNAARGDFYDIVWFEILALFKIAQELPNVYPIVSVRREIWRKLSIDSGNRDKYDQIRNFIHDLSPTRADLKNILEKRLAACIEKNSINSSNCYSPFFEGESCKLPQSEEHRRWCDYLISSSRENPRDIVQLVYALIQSAGENNRITEVDVEKTALQYSKERVNDIVSQNKDICTNLESVIQSFEKLDFELTAEYVKNHLSRIPGICAIKVNGRTLHPGDPDDTFLLWDVLFNIHFLNARTADNTKRDKYTFIGYDGTLVSVARWNDIQKYSWDIHPCYRSYLLDLKEKAKRRILLPSDKKGFKGNSTREERRQRTAKRKK